MKKICSLATAGLTALSSLPAAAQSTIPAGVVKREVCEKMLGMKNPALLGMKVSALKYRVVCVTADQVKGREGESYSSYTLAELNHFCAKDEVMSKAEGSTLSCVKKSS